MALRRKHLGKWALLGLVGLVAWQAAAYFWVERTRPDNLVNQVWLDCWPRDGRDMISHLVAIEHDGHRVGTTGRHSQWRVHSDGFLWGMQGDRVRARFPQTGQQGTFQARTWKCTDRAPKFELCLELTGQNGGQTQRYRFYSRKDWVIRPHDRGQAVVLPAEIAGLAPAVQAALAIPADQVVGDGPDTTTAGGDLLPVPAESALAPQGTQP